MRKKLLAVSLVMLLFLTGCSGKVEKEESTQAGEKETDVKTVVDQGGNEIEIPDSITKAAITPIPWASAMWAIDGGSDRIVSINPSSMAQYKKSFMTTLDPDFAGISTAEISQDFTINIEQLLNLKPEIAFIWNDQEAEAEKLKAVGITPVMLNYAENLDDLQKNILLMGTVLGKKERAQEIVDYQKEVQEYFTDKSDKTAKAEKPKVLYIQTIESLSVAGSKNINQTLLGLTGGENAAVEIDKKWAEVNMEQIMGWNPQVIFLSNFDSAVPEDLYQNKIPGQDWSNIDAVKNHRVYKTPVGILRWDAPCVETPFMLKWMGNILQPDIFNDYEVREDISDFYAEYFNYTLSQKELDTIFNVKLNQ